MSFCMYLGRSSSATISSLKIATGRRFCWSSATHMYSNVHSWEAEQHLWAVHFVWAWSYVPMPSGYRHSCTMWTAEQPNELNLISVKLICGENRSIQRDSRNYRLFNWNSVNLNHFSSFACGFSQLNHIKCWYFNFDDAVDEFSGLCELLRPNTIIVISKNHEKPFSYNILMEKNKKIFRGVAFDTSTKNPFRLSFPPTRAV